MLNQKNVIEQLKKIVDRSLYNAEEAREELERFIVVLERIPATPGPDYSAGGLDAGRKLLNDTVMTSIEKHQRGVEMNAILGKLLVEATHLKNDLLTQLYGGTKCIKQ